MFPKAAIAVQFLTVGFLLSHPCFGAENAPAKKSAKKKNSETEWRSLFDGKSLKGWEISKFGGEGDVSVEKGAIYLDIGNYMTGIRTTQEIPKIDYEVQLEAQRVTGTDFFCGFTFPVGKDPCSLILGGWGGGVCGLSSIDGLDASENQTTSYRQFKNGKWYTVRLRVTKEKIEAWIDDEKIVDQELDGRRVSIRSEVDLSRPFGFATFATCGALKDIKIRKLKPQKKTKG
ncbi:3-keto-disaccharide hydrolase [Thalassoroseus pseudoceratinae]|uniref:3-keto-disaccharide hydrolase n=1 Tax=Thalassoroseus pseudoceratinae TaxID=2713176 RepID=UPI001F0EF9E8|nr:DUF1080 domain-containing protein [Thalassoroseus pseudoceratinae]